MSIIIKGKTSFGPRIVTDGLVLYMDAANSKYYPGTGTICRDIYSGLSGTLLSATTYNSTTPKSFNFHGTDSGDGIFFYDSSGYVARDISYNAWVKIQEIDENWHTIMDHYNDYFFFGTSSNQFSMWVVGVNDPIYSGYFLSASTWYNLCVTHEYGGVFNFYVNGQFVSNGNGVTGNTECNDYIYTIGCGATHTGSVVTNVNESWYGDISIAQIYHRAISASEVLQNYNALKIRFI